MKYNGVLQSTLDTYIDIVRKLYIKPGKEAK
jgi:hypothetical protein